MNPVIKILVVEDEMIIGANISLQLTSLGYEVSGIIPRGEEALVHLKENQPDIVLMDINLKGKIDGVETALLMQQQFDIPIIYLTANADQANFERAKATHPYAFISKPFKKLDLQRAVELTVARLLTERSEDKSRPFKNDLPLVISDCIYVRHQEKMVKVPIHEIFYIEAERNYCRIHTKEKEYLQVMTLKDMEEKLPQNHFLRIHRSFIINLSQIDEVATDHLVVSRKAIPISKNLRGELLKRLQTL
ncbi:MAG: LytTR family transcriptional regulator DNA-binding domain-containing protein [Flavobacteriaceae bacterium]|nr:LytTR family transcriptional regulator DNA-binding domain-containing protein [Flavobacteriaceae bacterium]